MLSITAQLKYTRTRIFSECGVWLMQFEKRWLFVVIVGVCLGLGPLSADAQDLDDLMSDSTKNPKDKKASQETEEKPQDDYSEPDPWERPPADPEPAPKAKPKAVEADPTPPDGRPIQIGLQVGYGFEIENPQYGAHPYGLGIGLQGGYTFDFGLFVGLATNYYLGTSAAEDGFRINKGENINTWLLGVEVGYDVWFSEGVLFRPSAQLGLNGTFLESDPALDGGRSFWGTYFAPGISLLFPFAESFYIGGDVRLPIAMSNGNGSFTLAVTGGLRL